MNVRHAGGLELFAVLARESLGALARETVHLVDTFASVVARIISAVVRVRFAVRSFVAWRTLAFERSVGIVHANGSILARFRLTRFGFGHSTQVKALCATSTLFPRRAYGTRIVLSIDQGLWAPGIASTFLTAEARRSPQSAHCLWIVSNQGFGAPVVAASGADAAVRCMHAP